MSMINDEVATIIENENFVRCIVDDIILEKELFIMLIQKKELWHLIASMQMIFFLKWT